MNEDRLQPDRRASGTSNQMTSGGADINVQTMFMSHQNSTNAKLDSIEKEIKRQKDAIDSSRKSSGA